MPAAASLEQSVGLAIDQFAKWCAQAAADATALTNVVYGLADGNDYGRYFYGQDPLVTYRAAAASLDALIAQGSVQQAAVMAAIVAAIAAASDIAGFAAAVPELTEAVRQACANPADAVRLLTAFCGFTATVGSTALPEDDGLGMQLYFLTARAVLRIRTAAAGSLVIASADYQPTSQGDAAALSQQISDTLDNLELVTADLFDDPTSHAIEADRVAVVEDMTARGGALPPLEIREVGRAMPAKVLAYRFYQDAGRAGDLVARNDPPNPAFMPLSLETLAY